MNIIVPKDESVGYFVLDLRDALEGKEMRYDNGPNSLPECVLIVPKKYLTIRQDGKYGFKLLNNYIKEEIANLDIHPDRKFAITKLINIENSLKMGKKIIYMQRGQKSVTVSAPLWKNSVQLIDVVIMNPIKQLGETEKFIDVQEGGICSADLVHEIVPDCVPGNCVKEVMEEVYNLGL